MKRLWTVIGAALLAAGPAQLRAAPPTVTPSPGYDARLQEQHKAAASASSPNQAVTPTGTPRPRHHTRRKH